MHLTKKYCTDKFLYLSQFQVQFIMRSSEYEFKRQYYTYDWNSFISDVGGNLGVFLGMSMLSLYDLGWKLLQKIYQKTFKMAGKGRGTQLHRLVHVI